MHTKGEQSADEGFTLVEVIVASAIFLAIGTAVTAALMVALRTAATNEGRVQAANLAARQIDLVRSGDVSALAGTTYDVQRGSLRYRVTQTVDSQTVDVGGSACDGASGAEAVKRVTVIVTWDGMGDATPVRSDTYRTLPVTGSSATKGTLTYKVVDRNGTPAAGAPIALRKGGTLVKTSTTRADGCVVFSNLDAGTDYTGTLTQAGFVNNQHLASVSKANVVVARTVTKDPGFVWDGAALLTVSASAPAGYPVPSNVPLSLFNSNLTSGSLTLPGCGNTPCASLSTTASGATWTARGLFPFASTYQLSSGACGTACTRAQTSVQATPGQTTVAAAPAFGGVAATAGTLVSGVLGSNAVRTLTATNADLTSERYTFPTATGGDGTPAKMALPPGRWYIAQNPGETNDAYRVLVTVQPGQTYSVAVLAR
ncbi:prepilin-type N-terminal cleavage/methylation domain-containing protein [Kineococcus sp. TBRC 1896]|uniref:Prepilin-type N-terminal cleavage/methylation domain-containing protein n=1 Tax=Kineococcus mangrovi TaxID=1660183 RepID=A0ABV4I2P6_9ACTN